MSAWALAFPLDVLAAAAVLVYHYTLFDTMQVRGSWSLGFRAGMLCFEGFFCEACVAVPGVLPFCMPLSRGGQILGRPQNASACNRYSAVALTCCRM